VKGRRLTHGKEYYVHILQLNIYVNDMAYLNKSRANILRSCRTKRRAVWYRLTSGRNAVPLCILNTETSVIIYQTSRCYNKTSIHCHGNVLSQRYVYTVFLFNTLYDLADIQINKINICLWVQSQFLRFNLTQKPICKFSVPTCITSTRHSFYLQA